MIDPQPLGDRGFLARFLDEADARDWDAAARSALQDYGRGVEIVLAFRCVAVHADPELVDLDLLEERLRSIEPGSGPGSPGATGRLVTIPTLYDGADLDEAADRLGLSVSEVIDRHISAEYRVRAVGFCRVSPMPARSPARSSDWRGDRRRGRRSRPARWRSWATRPGSTPASPPAAGD